MKMKVKADPDCMNTHAAPGLQAAHTKMRTSLLLRTLPTYVSKHKKRKKKLNKF